MLAFSSEKKINGVAPARNNKFIKNILQKCRQNALKRNIC